MYILLVVLHFSLDTLLITYTMRSELKVGIQNVVTAYTKTDELNPKSISYHMIDE